MEYPLIVAIAGFGLMQFASDLGITRKIFVAISAKWAAVPTAPYGPGETWKWLAILAVGILWAAGLHYAAKERKFERRIVFFAGSALLPLLAFHFVIPQLVIYSKAPGPFLARIADKVNPEDTIVAYNNMFPAASWYFRRNDVYMLHKGGEMGYGLKYSDAAHRLISESRFAEMTKEPRRGKLIFLMKTKKFRDMALPASFEIYEPAKERIMFSIYDSTTPSSP